MKPNDSIEVVKNIGRTRADELKKLGIETVEDLIEYYPRDYEDRSSYVPVGEAEAGKINTIRGRVAASPDARRMRTMTVVSAGIADKSGTIECVWFNQPYVKNQLTAGREYSFTGKVVEKYGRLQMESPDYEPVNENSLNTGRIVPIYTVPKKMSQKVIRGCIKNAMDSVEGTLEEYMPNRIVKKHNLCDRAFAVRNIHFPESDSAFFKARRRLVFDELLFLQLHLLELKGNICGKKSNIAINKYNDKEIRKQLGFELTRSQEKVLCEIKADFKTGSVMNRLIQGDVGSGKTALAMIAAYIVISNGYQAVLMAPTDVLANQHFKSFIEVFEPLGIKCELLTSGLRKKERDRVYDNIATGCAKMIIGTHALIQDRVEYNNLGLVITDEQHRFGVRQREMLSNKGDEPHVLVMTATPIPRTLALILYGDLDISIIDELPPGRKKVDTFSVDHSYYQRLYAFIKKEVSKGRQAYIICPMIEENDKTELRSVLNYTEELDRNILPELRVSCVHGKMKNDEKQIIMEEFEKGNIDVLVSTTVIEVGINVPNASLMIIENAERFGLSTLHQLRGRVGRGSEKSYCVLVSDAKSKVAKERMSIMCKTNDGFVISEKDLKLRGPGDFFGTRQHGLPEMKIANLYKDIEILKEVQGTAIDLYNHDRELNSVENSLLKAKIFNIFTTKIKKICL
ncbi:MAG: ATP-dependent DNA helicase RecG [Clostridia bacterium]|nr:ATP-dependent DNA helicase RecG [Clostridia bacterium]